MLKHFSIAGAIALTAAAGVRAQPGGDVNTVVAMNEMQTLANALTLAALDTTYYVSLENLNDVSGTSPTLLYDSIQHLSGPYVMIPDHGLFIGRRNLATRPVNFWRGPYVSYQQENTQAGTTPYDEGSPLDPWRQPYYLFNPLGLLRGDAGIITLELYGDSFDRYTIVSLGPDGVMSADDLAYPFGGDLIGSYLTSLAGDGVRMTSAAGTALPVYTVDAGTTLTLRGYGFGAPGPNSGVYLGDVAITQVLRWSGREIDVIVPETLVGTTDVFRVKVHNDFTSPLTATITDGVTRVKNWEMY